MLKVKIAIHLVQNLAHVIAVRSEDALIVRLGKATSRDDIRLALYGQVSLLELEKILSIWGDSETRRTYTVVDRTVIISEAAE